MAVPPGMFSVHGAMAMTFTFACSRASAPMAAITLAAPDMSPFIASMFYAGLSEMPPVSKVMPLPMSAIGRPFPAPRYCSTMNLGGCAEPFATDR